jgi:Holliday junction resolvase RusA-like endonuclease
MKYTLEFELAGLPQIESNGSHSNFFAVNSRRRKWHRLVLETVKDKLPASPLAKANLTLTRHSLKEPDLDNLYGSFKPVVDGLVKAGVLLNDKQSNLVEYKVRWEKAPKNKGKVTVKVEAA